MHIEIVAIGDELVNGRVINSNAAFISRRLFLAGYPTDRQVVFGDDQILKDLRASFKSADVVIVTGGLGPTLDDKTKKAAASLFKIPLVLDQKWKKELVKRGLKNPFLENQASVPKGSLVLPNDLGTAPGLILKKNQQLLILLPGVPGEMQVIFDEWVLPFLKKAFPLKQKLLTEEVNLGPLQEIEVAPFLEEMAKKEKELARKNINRKGYKRETEEKVQIGIYPHFATLKIIFTLKSPISQKASSKAKARLGALKKKLETMFAPYVFAPSLSSSSSSHHAILAASLRDFLIKKKKTLAVAESCTGGALTATLTAEAGASKYFLGGLVTYNNNLKTSLLKVKPATLKKHGAVSSETVSEMLKGIFKVTEADFGIAISGVAGPSGGTSQKPVGTVFFAIGQRGKKAEIIQLNFPPKRSEVINFATSFALSRLWGKIKVL